MEHMSRWRRNLKESANKVRDKISLFNNKNATLFFDYFGIEYIT